MKKNPLFALLCSLSVASIVVAASPFQAATVCQPIKVTVDGEGYLRLSRDGRAVYAKSATLIVSANGKVATAQGDAVLPTIQAPIITKNLFVDLEGNVFAVRDANRAKIGRLVLALFPADSVLDEKDGVLYAAERPKLGNPGDETHGVIRCEAVATVSTQSKSPITIEPVQKPDAAKPVVPKSETPLPVKGDQNEPKPEPQAAQPKPKSTSNSLRITAKAAAEAEGETVTLGDIATIEGPDHTKKLLAAIEVGDAPALGAKRSFDRLRILAKIKQAGIDPEEAEITLPAMVSVSRVGQTISHGEFVQAALKALYDSPGIATEYLVDDTGPDFVAPAGTKALVVETISGVNTATATVKVAVYVGTKRINSRTLSLKAKSLPVVAKIGSPVRVSFLAGGARVDVQGVLRSAGTVGTTVQVEVRLPGSDRTMHAGSLLADGSVEVKL